MGREKGRPSSSVGKLLGGIKKLNIEDEDSIDPSRLRDGFPNHWKAVGGWTPASGGGKRTPITLYSHLSVDEERIACGLSNGEIFLVSAERPVLPKKVKGQSSSSSSTPSGGRHDGLTCVRSSKVNPEIVYSGSGKDGTICLWDFRQMTGKPAQRFSIGSTKIGGNGDGASSSIQSVKPIICLDISPGDQILCAGTELVGEDSFVLFWDARNQGGKLLGAYWESHSDDVTSMQFHPEKYNSLATGSTDGLLNVFDLLQPDEDEALIYSLNTESSVESIYWSLDKGSSLPSSSLSCVTHCNQVQIWDGESGDKFLHFDRTAIAEAIMRSNPEAVYVSKCYPTNAKSEGKGQGLGFLTCSLKGSCTRFASVNDKTLSPNGLFESQIGIVQTAEYVSKVNRWVTFDEDGVIKVWVIEPESEDAEEPPEEMRKKRKKYHQQS